MCQLQNDPEKIRTKNYRSNMPPDSAFTYGLINRSVDFGTKRPHAEAGRDRDGISDDHIRAIEFRTDHAHGHSPAWQSSVPTIAPRVPATFSRRRGLRRLPGEGSLERRVCLPPLSAEEYLPIIHLVFANLKTWLNGIHHGVSHQHLQAYLNEFTFRFNKRFYPFNAFRSLLGIAGDVTAPYLRRALLRSLAASYM